ncbi:MAG: mRNA interferase MazF [Salibacteraceae bacterium]|jgi:mRNA interferase MazF
MKQGEIWYANLNPTKGNKQSGFRPIINISGNMLNTHLPIVICCPLTTQIKNYKGNVILNPRVQNGLDKQSEVLTLHVRSVSKERLVKRIGMISESQTSQVKECLDDILTL